MNNFKKPGDTVTLVVPAAITSGVGALIGVIFGVAASNYAQGESGEFRRTGQIGFPRATGNPNAAGDKAYWDDAAKVVTPTAAGNKLIGAFIEAKAPGDAYAEVILIPTAA